MYHLLPRFLLQVNVSCQGSCPGLRWLSMTYLYAPVRASLGSELCIWRDSTPSRYVSILSPLTRPILCTWRELCKHFIWTVDRSRCFWKGQGMKGQFTLFSNSSTAHSGHNWHLPSNCPQDSLLLQGRPSKWNSPESYCAEVRCGKGPNWQLRLVAMSSNMDLPITAAYLSLIWPRKNWKLLNNSWVITQARANLQVRSWFSPHGHILKKESSFFFLILFAKAQCFEHCSYCRGHSL